MSHAGVRPGLGVGLAALGAGVALNSWLGPLLSGQIRYRFSESLIAQGVGLDAVSLLLVAPLCLLAGLMALRGHATAPVLALPAAAYVAYMAVQYVVGPEYLELAGNNERFFPFHLALFALGTALAVRAWSAVDAAVLDPTPWTGERRLAVALLLLAGLLALRYAPGIAQLVAGAPTFPEYRTNPTSFFLIATMDLGIALPATVATGIGLWRGRRWARKALCGIVGWFALVGTAVAAMAATLWVRGVPGTSPGQVAGFGVAAGLLLGLAAVVYAPLVRRRTPGAR